MLDWLQSNLGSNIVGGLVVLAIATAIPGVRRWMVRIALRSWRLLRSLRVVTTAKMAAERQRGWDERQAALDTERAVPSPQPRWRVDRVSTPIAPFAHSIVNSATDAVASDVELSADPALFAFHDRARFADLSANKLDWFNGKATAQGKTDGVMFTVTWTDVRGDRKTGQAFLDREPPHTRVSKAHGF